MQQIRGSERRSEWFTSTLVYPPEPKWCGGPVTYRVRAASAEEAEATIAKLTERRWRSDGRASAFVEEGEG